MIRSMTGFGSAEHEMDVNPLEIEIRTVNHRHLDVRVRFPRFLSALETDVKARVRDRLERGRVDIHIGFVGHAQLSPELAVDFDLAAQYRAAAEKLSKAHGVEEGMDARVLLEMPGVSSFVEPPIDENALREGLFGAIDRALESVLSMREAEGRVLTEELKGRLSRIELLTGEFEERSAEVVELVRDRLSRRMKQLELESGVADTARLHQEIVLATDRLDITEELVRLRSHVEQFRAILAEGGTVGRRLDFLIQEMAREANTVGSKANDAPMSQDVVELKAELERMREQVQNIE